MGAAGRSSLSLTLSADSIGAWRWRSHATLADFPYHQPEKTRHLTGGAILRRKRRGVPILHVTVTFAA
jgi:hypothetical protein